MDDDRLLYPPAHAASPPRQGRPARFLLVLLAFMLCGGVIGALAAKLGLALPRAFVAGAGVAFVVGLWPNVVLHELGHALAGRLRGFRLLAFGVGPLRLERTHAGRLRWRWTKGVRGISGFAAMLPPRGRAGAAADMVVYGLGGPAMNLATAALLAWPAAATALPLWLRGACAGMAGAALLLGVVNLVPFHTRGWRSDGRGVLDLLRGAPDAALQLQVNALSALSLAGVRPRDWPAADLPAADAASASPLLALAGEAMRLSWACDRRDAPAAFESAARLARDFGQAPDGLRTHLAVALAGHAAVLRRNPALLAAWRPHCEGVSLTDLLPYRHWLDAEHAALAGDAGTARTHLAAAREALDRIGDPASRQLVDEHLRDLQARLDG